MLITGKSRNIVLGSLQNASGYPMPEDMIVAKGLSPSALNDIFWRILKRHEYYLNEEEKSAVEASLRACLKYIDDWEIPAVFDVDITKEDVQKFYDEHFKSDDGK
jgi:hypothetical protein